MLVGGEIVKNILQVILFTWYKKCTIVGLVIEMIAGIIMAIMVIANTVIPDVIAWIFEVGLVITLVSCVFTLGKRNK